MGDLTAADVETIREMAMILGGYMRGEVADRGRAVAEKIEEQISGTLAEPGDLDLAQRMQTDDCSSFHIDGGRQLPCAFLYGHSGSCADRYGRRFG